MRRLVACCLAVLLIAGLAVAYELSTASVKAGPPAAIRAATPEQCQAPAYALNQSYQAGSLVTNVGHAYACKPGPGQAWCNLAEYEPGKPFNGAEFWKEAWDDLGECGATPQTNTLELSFSTVSGKVPFTTASRGVGPQARRDLEVSGVLRCNAQAIPFSGRSDQVLTLTDLAPCKYAVIMDAAQGYLPLTTPTVVEFMPGQSQKLSLEVKYRQPLDLTQLLTLPGVKVELFATGLSQPRQMVMGNNVLYVGSSAIPNYSYNARIASFIYAIPLDQAGRPTGIHLITSGEEEPHGVAYRDGDLYYSTTGKLYRVANVDQTYRDPRPEVVLDFPPDQDQFRLPNGSHRVWHQKHPLSFNPFDAADQALYTAVGIPCNHCMVTKDERYGTVLSYDLKTRESRILAKGVRNAVGLAWASNGDLWFSDNNRQGFLNSDEVNRIAKGATGKQMHFGVPYLYGRDTLGFTQEEYTQPGNIAPPLLPGAIVSDLPLNQIKPENYQAPAYELGSNTAPLGIAFWKGFHNEPGDLARLLVAVHGTGTQASPGMELRMLTIEDGVRVVSQIPLATGWSGGPGDFNVYCLDGSCLGRPAGILELADNSILVSDDVAGVIYRFTFDPVNIDKTTLRLQPTAAPVPELAPTMFSGTLTDSQGRTRRFDVAWGQTPLIIRALDEGTYTVALDNIGDFIPKVRQQQVTLSASTNDQTVELGYMERPPIEPVKATLVAPQKPAFAGGAPEYWEVTHLSEGKTSQVKVPWGGSQMILLGAGEHVFNYPYYPGELPEPTQRKVSVDELSNEPITLQMSYRHTPALGQEVVATTCAACHTVQYFQDANRAINWSLAGKEALVQQILGMTVRGQCDSSCSSQIADYFYNDLWAGYLDPKQAYGKRQLRLLTRDEYANSVRDLFSVAVKQDALPADKSKGHFKYPGDADAGVIQAEDLKALYDVAWQVAEEVDTAWLDAQPTAQLGRRVFRRALTASEVQRYDALRTKDGANALVAALLLSPNFLYRSELGEAPAAGDIYQLSASERATALSYSLLGTTPSEELLLQAEQGQLQTPEQIGAAAQRMLLSEQGQAQFNRFISYYLKTYRGAQEKPGLTPAVIDSMVQEQAQLVGQVLRDGGSFNALFNPGYTFLDQRLAQHYAIAGVSGDSMRKVSVDPRRGGLLHLGMTQAVNSDYQATSLVKRGIMIREQLLCREFGAPVEADPNEPAYPPRAITTRERWDLVNGQNASEGRCWQCHQYMNDTGSSMENYDASGRYREVEQAYNHAQYPVNMPINAAGPFISNTGLENWAQVNNLRDVAELLPGNATAQTCMADSYFRFMFGNKVSAGSVSTLKSASEALNANGSLIQMIRDMTTSPVFLNRQEEN